MQRKTKNIAIYGAGGFGREILAHIKDINKQSEDKFNIIGFFDDGREKGLIVNNYPTLGGMEELNLWPEDLSVVVAVGGPVIKRDIISRITNLRISFPTLIHPSAYIGDADYVKIGKGCLICAGTFITTNIEIKDFVILNLGCTVGHDTVINDYASFMPSVNISGEVVIGESVYVGTGAKIINQVSIGEGTIVGAGAVVAKSLPSHCTAVGVPAMPIKFHTGL